MKNTVATPLSERLLKDPDDVVPFLNKELIPLNRELRAALNSSSVQVATVSTAGDAASTALWTSDAMPTNSSWLVKADVVGRTVVGGQQASYGLIGLYTNEAGVVSQIGATALPWTIESAAACHSTLAVSGQTVVLAVIDDGASAMDWKALVSILPTSEV